MTALTTPHERALTVLFSELERSASEQSEVVERYPGAIEDAISAVPKSAVRHLMRAIKALEKHLPRPPRRHGTFSTLSHLLVEPTKLARDCSQALDYGAGATPGGPGGNGRSGIALVF